MNTKAKAGTRSVYLSDWSDEIMPCEPSLEAWAAWLSKGGDAQWPVENPPADGDVLDATAILWSEDIIARRVDGAWQLSRGLSEGEDFAALRYGEGLGWSPDSIVTEGFSNVAGFLDEDESLQQAIVRCLIENDEYCDDVEYVAVGKNESLKVVFRVDPARLEMVQ